MISQQTICGHNESLELTNDMEYSKEQTELKKMRSNLKRAREVYFKYFPSQEMAHTKATVRKRAMIGVKTVPQPQPAKKVKKGRLQESVLKNLGKITQHSSKKIPISKVSTRYTCSLGNLEIPEDKRSAHP